METSVLVPPPSPSGTRAQHAAFGVLALLLVLVGLYTLRGFLPALAWAGIFAIALWPLYRRAINRFGTGRHNLLLPILFTLAVVLLFVVPLALVGAQLAIEGQKAAAWARDASANGIQEPALLHRLPFGQASVDKFWQENLADPGSAREYLGRLTHGRAGTFGRVIGMQVLHRLTSFVFTILALFFLFRDGSTLIEQLRRGAARAFGPGGERVGRQIIASVKGTVDGLVLVALGEGVVLGVIYAAAGLPHPTILGALTAAAALIPAGALVMIALASAIALATSSALKAILIFVIGETIAFSAEHFIRPTLIGGATRLPFLWVLLGILGGAEAFGLLGLFLGPAIMAALILLWREWCAA